MRCSGSRVVAAGRPLPTRKLHHASPMGQCQKDWNRASMPADQLHLDHSLVEAGLYHAARSLGPSRSFLPGHEPRGLIPGAGASGLLRGGGRPGRTNGGERAGMDDGRTDLCTVPHWPARRRAAGESGGNARDAGSVWRRSSWGCVPNCPGWVLLSVLCLDYIRGWAGGLMPAKSLPPCPVPWTAWLSGSAVRAGASDRRRGLKGRLAWSPLPDPEYEMEGRGGETMDCRKADIHGAEKLWALGLALSGCLVAVSGCGTAYRHPYSLEV